MKYYKIPNGYLACEKELDYERISFDVYQQAIKGIEDIVNAMRLEQENDSQLEASAE